MLRSFFFISRSGEPLIEKHWRGTTPRGVCDFFWEEVSKYDAKEDVPPVLLMSKFYLISIYREESYMLAVTTEETPPLVVVEFLHRTFDIFEEYFGAIEETTIKDNFATVYQLLEELMDFGYPLTTEPNVLKEMIDPPTVLSRITSAATGKSYVSDTLPDGTISSIPWRKAGVSYSQNEIYMDIVEEMDATLDRSGTVLSIDVSGSIIANSRLSGIPDISLQFTDPTVIDDCSFHPCVRYLRYERDKIVSFVPPDGQFELMKYRVARNKSNPNSNYSNIVPPCFVQSQLSFDYSQSHGQISVLLGVKSAASLIFPPKTSFTQLEEVVVIIPFSKNVKTANLSVSAGSCLFDESTKTARWTVGKFSKDRTPQLNGSVLLAGTAAAGHEESPVIEVQWKVPMASVSGLGIGALNITNEIYKPYKGVRSLTKSGKFQIRSS